MSISSISNDYYETLELSRDCSQEDITESFRRLSLKYLPKNAKDDREKKVYLRKFHQLCEAYEVLSDINKKGIYDIYGQDGLYNGVLDKEGNIKGGYKYIGNCDEIFENFMGNIIPFALVNDHEKMGDEYNYAFGSAFGGQKQEINLNLPDIHVDLYCTLKELYNGTVKTITYKKNKLSSDKRTTNLIEEVFDVEIFKGFDKNTIITYKGRGNEEKDKITSDLIVHIREIKNDLFKRVNKSDLLYTKKITLSQALNSVPVLIKTLDDRNISISMDEIISPKTVRIVKGEGMPVYDKKTFTVSPGDLFIRFNIIFPEFIDTEKKDKIIELLKPDIIEENDDEI